MDLENRDPFPPPEDYLKSGENMGALLSPGGKAWLGWLLQPGLLLPEMGKGAAHRACLGGHTAAHPSHTASSAFFIGTVGWVSASWGPDSGAVSWRWVLAVHEGRAADWGCWGPLFPVPHCSLLSGCSAAPDTQSGHSGTPGENREDQ